MIQTVDTVLLLCDFHSCCKQYKRIAFFYRGMTINIDIIILLFSQYYTMLAIIIILGEWTIIQTSKLWVIYYILWDLGLLVPAKSRHNFIRGQLPIGPLKVKYKIIFFNHKTFLQSYI